jgi:hypothetical protein
MRQALTVMAQDLVPQNQPSMHDLHPRIVVAIAVCTVWFVIAAFLGFAIDPQSAYPLLFVALLFTVALLLPYSLYRAWRKANRGHDEAQLEQSSFHDWARRDFETWQDRVKGANAATEVMVPIAAAAIGMTAFGIVFHIAERFSG